MSYRNQVAFAKAEATPGTLETFTMADAIPCESTTPSIEVTPAARNILAGNLPGRSTADLMTEQRTAVQLKTEVSGSGTPGTPSPIMAKLLLMAGFNQTIATGSSVVHAMPWPFPSARYSFAFDADLQRYAGKGGLVSTVTFSGEAGGFMMMESSLTGIYVPIQAVSVLSGTPPALIDPAPFNSSGIGSVTIAGVSACIASYSCTVTNQVEFFEDGNCAPNFKVADRTVAVSITIQRPPLATVNLFEKALKSEVVALNIAYGTVPGNITTFNHPRLQLSVPALQDRKGQNYLTIEGDQKPLIAADQFTITQT
jgi:hypothetical protein